MPCFALAECRGVSVECRYLVSRMPCLCQSNAVCPSAECRVGVASTGLKVRQSNAVPFWLMLPEFEMPFLRGCGLFFDLDDILIDFKVLNSADSDQGLQGFAHPQFEVAGILGATAAELVKRLQFQRIRCGMRRQEAMQP